jgi:valyl-tRNA synthetase
VQKQHDQIATKLGNEGFVAKAPAAVVEVKKRNWLSLLTS